MSGLLITPSILDSFKMKEMFLYFFVAFAGSFIANEIIILLSKRSKK